MPLLLKNGVEIYIYFISNPSVCAFQEVYTLPIWTSKAIFSKWRNFGLHISYSLTSYISTANHATKLCDIPL